jgi:hypothetical protein
MPGPAGTARSREVYLLAANYLQTLGWHTSPELVKHITSFYNKAQVFAHRPLCRPGWMEHKQQWCEVCAMMAHPLAAAAGIIAKNYISVVACFACLLYASRATEVPSLRCM